MPDRELDSILSRAMLGIMPITNVPEVILSQFSLIGWDHQKNPGFIWRLSDLTLQDVKGKVYPINGFNVTNYEVVAVIRGKELFALIPEGSWVMKPESMMATLNVGKIELIWIDLRTITLLFEVTDLRTETGRHKLNGELAINVIDPTKLVNKLVLSDKKDLSKDIQDDVLNELLTLMTNEASTCSPDDPLWQQHIEESSKTKLAKKISDWGLMPAYLKTIEERREGGSAQRVKTNEIQINKVPNEDISSPGARIPKEATPISRITETPRSDDAPIQMLEWDSAPKRWIPSIRREKVACDGCNEHPDIFVECRLSCQFHQKCRLCKDCYPKRSSCVFLIEVADVPPSPLKMEERFAQSTETEKGADSTTTTRYPEN